MTTTAGVGVIPQFEVRHRMARALEVSGVSVADMAEYLEVHRNTVGSWLHGRTRPSRAVLRMWALRTGVPHSWIETGIDPGPVPPNTPVSDCQPGDPWYSPDRELALADAA